MQDRISAIKSVNRWTVSLPVSWFGSWLLGEEVSMEFRSEKLDFTAIRHTVWRKCGGYRLSASSSG